MHSCPALNCVNTYKLCFLCIANINFVDTDLFLLVTAQMSYYSNSLIKYNNFIKKVMHAL